MHFELRLLRRTLFARRRGLARFTASIAVIGIAAGVASLIVALAVSSGFQNELRDRLLSDSPHIAAFRDDRGHITDPTTLITNIETVEGVVSANGTATAPALYSGPNGSAYALITASENGAVEFTGKGYEALLGVELAANTGTASGDTGEILIVSNGEAKALKKLAVTGTFKTGIYEHDAVTIKTAPNTFAALAGEPAFQPNQIDIRVNNADSAPEIAVRIREVVGIELRVIDWQSANQPLFAALSLEERAATTVILLILFIAVLNITTTLTLIVAERRHDIAVLRSYGARLRSIVLMFVAEGVFVGLAGTILGVLIGWVFCFAANRFGLFRLDPQVYSIANIPLYPNITEILFIAVGAIVLSALASVYPAFRAARVKPLDLLRDV